MNKGFSKPTERLKNGNYKMKSGIVYTCFSTDFLIEEADGWRTECWKMMKERQDCTFLFLTKRIERFMECIPDDWNNGTVIDRAATKILPEKQETCFPVLSKTK